MPERHQPVCDVSGVRGTAGVWGPAARLGHFADRGRLGDSGGDHTATAGYEWKPDGRRARDTLPGSLCMGSAVLAAWALRPIAIAGPANIDGDLSAGRDGQLYSCVAAGR